MKNLLILAAFAALSFLTNCASETSTDKELAMAKVAVEAAEITQELALVVYGPRLTTGTWSPAEKLVAEKIISESRERLAAERARLVDIQTRRAAAVAAPPSGEGGPPASPLLPAVTGTK